MSNKGFLSGYKLILLVVAIVVVGGLVVFSALSPSGQLVSSSGGVKYTSSSGSVRASPDTTAPKVTVVSSVVKGNPNAWNNGIWVNTSATDAVGLKTITSYFRFFGNNTATQKVCNLNGAKSSRCDFFITSNAPLVGGTQHYWGEAVDTTGNSGRDPPNGETSIDWP